jgi:acetyl esterase
MPLDSELREYYNRLRVDLAPMVSTGVQARRDRLRAIGALLDETRPVALDVTDFSMELEGRTLAARLYRPHGVVTPALAVFFHGGGWVVGDLDTHDLVAARLADALRCAVVSVDYRRAPEASFPAPCDDAADAVMWLAEHRKRLGFATGTLAVIGDSAGAHLAAGAALAVNERVPGLISAQLLLYPMVDTDFTRPSYAANAGGPGISLADIEFYWASFLPSSAPQDDGRALLLSHAPLSAAPATVLAVAEFDPLSDEGREYAAHLERHGAQVELIEAEGMTHGFMRVQGASKAAGEWAARIIQRFDALWARG